MMGVWHWNTQVQVNTEALVTASLDKKSDGCLLRLSSQVNTSLQSCRQLCEAGLRHSGALG